MEMSGEWKMFREGLLGWRGIDVEKSGKTLESLDWVAWNRRRADSDGWRKFREVLLGWHGIDVEKNERDLARFCYGGLE